MTLYGLGREDNGGLVDKVIIRGKEGVCKGCRIGHNTIASSSKGNEGSTCGWSSMLATWRDEGLEPKGYLALNF